MSDIEQYVSIYELSQEKNHQELERGDGFINPDPGSIAGALHPKEPAQFLAILELEKDAARGSHYHLEKTEYIAIMQGVVLVELTLVEHRDVVKKIVLSAGQVIKMLPGCIHTFTAQGADAVALEYSPDRFSQQDVYFV